MSSRGARVCAGSSVLGAEGRRLTAENKNSYGTNMTVEGLAFSQGCVARLEPLVSDVDVIDGITDGMQIVKPYSVIKWSTQPERLQNMYNVVHAQVSNNTGSGFPFGSNSIGLIDFLGGGGLFAGVVHNQPNPLMPQDDEQSYEYETVHGDLGEQMVKRFRTISPGFVRQPTDLVADAEPLMTEGYKDMSAIKAANYLQWSRGISDCQAPWSAQRANDSFLQMISSSTPGYARIQEQYALKG